MSNSPFFCVTSDISSNKVRHHQRLLRFLSVSVCPAISSPYGSISGEQCELECSFSSSSPQTVPAMFSASPHTVTLSRTLPHIHSSPAPPATSSWHWVFGRIKLRTPVSPFSYLRATHATVQAEYHLSKCLGPEIISISEFFRFGSICIDYKLIEDPQSEVEMLQNPRLL